MVKVSIIVPVYNVERYLGKCLDSLINQTLEEIEIIVVNDGSTDGCQKIIEEYSKKSTKVKAYLKKNGGLSDARNYGLGYAIGEYIGFVDSDDYVDYDMYEKLYEKAIRENSDIVECNLKHTYPGFEDIEIGEKIYDKKEMIMFGRSVVWNKIYKTDWLLKTKVKFSKGLIYEDVEFFIKLVPYITKYSYIDEASIHYVQRGNSINNFSSVKTLDILKILNNIFNYYKETGWYEEYKDALEFLYARIILCSSFYRMCRIKEKAERIRALRSNWCFLNEIFPHWRMNKYLKNTKTKKAYFMKSMNCFTYRVYSKLIPQFYFIKNSVNNIAKE